MRHTTIISYRIRFYTNLHSETIYNEFLPQHNPWKISRVVQYAIIYNFERIYNECLHGNNSQSISIDAMGNNSIMINLQ